MAISHVDFGTYKAAVSSAVYGEEVRGSIANEIQATEDALNGSFDEINSAINNQLIQLDDTLSIPGRGADAAAVGVIKDTLAQYAAVFNGNVDESVQNWLDAHPEATTTVQDHSLTANKLVLNALGFVTPEMFGAVGDGVTDDSAAFTAAFAYDHVRLETKVYVVNASIPCTAKIVDGGGATLKYTREYRINNLIEMQTLTDVEISDLTIDGGGYAARGIMFANALNSAAIRRCEIKNLDNTDANINTLAIGFANDVDTVYVEDCYVHDIYASTQTGGSVGAAGVALANITAFASVSGCRFYNIHSSMLYDADALKLFSKNAADPENDDTVFEAYGNRFFNCSGRFVKVQAEHANVHDNYFELNDSYSVQDNFIVCDFQQCSGTFVNNKVNIVSYSTGAVKVVGSTFRTYSTANAELRVTGNAIRCDQTVAFGIYLNLVSDLTSNINARYVISQNLFYNLTNAIRMFNNSSYEFIGWVTILDNVFTSCTRAYYNIPEEQIVASNNAGLDDTVGVIGVTVPSDATYTALAEAIFTTLPTTNRPYVGYVKYTSHGTYPLIVYGSLGMFTSGNYIFTILKTSSAYYCYRTVALTQMT